MRRFILTIVLALILVPAVAVPVYAGVTVDPLYLPKGLPTIDGTVPAVGTVQEPNSEINRVRLTLTRRLMNIVLGVGGVVAVYFIINSGFYLIISAGAEDAVTTHKKALTWAIGGLVLIVLAYSIVSYIVFIAATSDQESIAPAASSAAPAGGDAAPPAPPAS